MSQSNQEQAEYQRNAEIQRFDAFLKKENDAWENIKLNVAVIGNSGVGKSSFINRIRHLNADDIGAAVVSNVETTMSIASYPHPDNANLLFWDLPGVGTPTFQQRTYLKDIDFGKYDFFLLLSSGRFTENDMWLGENIKKAKKKYYYVRTRIDNDLTSHQALHPKTHNRESELRKIREHLRRALKQDDTPVFLICNFDSTQFDFPKLEASLAEDFPELKREAMILSMHSTSSKMVQMKAAVLRVRTKITAILFSMWRQLGSTVSHVIQCVTDQVLFFMKKHGIDDESLKRLATNTSNCVYSLIETVRSTSECSLTIESITAFVSRRIRAENVDPEEFSGTPVQAEATLMPASCHFMQNLLQELLNMVLEAALKIVSIVPGA